LSGERIDADSAMKCTPQKNDHPGGGFCRFHGEGERVAGDVGYLLHLIPHVVMGQEHSIPFLQQFAYFLLYIVHVHFLFVGVVRVKEK